MKQEGKKNRILLLVLGFGVFLCLAILLLVKFIMPGLFNMTPPATLPPAPIPPPPVVPIAVEGMRIPVYIDGEEFPIAIIYAEKAKPKGMVVNLTKVKVDMYDGKKLVIRYLAVNGSLNQNTKTLTLNNVNIMSFDKNGKVGDNIRATKASLKLDKKLSPITIHAK